MRSIIFGKIIAEMIAVRRKKKLTVTSCRRVIFSNFPADTRVIIIKKSHMVSDQDFYYVFERIRRSDFHDAIIIPPKI